MFGKSGFFSREKKETAALIRPDFKIEGDAYDPERNLRWHWNWDQLKDSPQRKKYAAIVKLAFPFDEPNLLDDCPFMCKIGENIGASRETKYYGVAYATEEETQAVREWGQRFPHAKLITDLEPFGAGTTKRSETEYLKNEV